MRGFGWGFKAKRGDGDSWTLTVEGSGKRGKFLISRQDPFRIARSVEALLAKAAGHLRIKMEGIPELIPPTIRPHMIALDSITALESAFVGKPESYRIYIEQLFRLFEETGATTFLITETEEAPTRFSKTGVEEFLADGVFVLYNFKVRDTRARAIEVLKLRGAEHERKIVPFTIAEKGIEVFPNERIYEIG
jgi:KaiC/GvpD/RAD55 family RecA-like ATPase